MKLIIDKDRKVYSAGTWGTKNENDYEILEFEFPAELEEYNKRIVYYLDDERVWDAIVDNKAYITNAITTKGDVKAYVWCTKENTEREADTDFRTQLFEMNFYENENASGIVPTEEQIDGFNTMLTAMNEKIEEIDELETIIKNAESQRQENEETRQNNEKTRQENEQTRQNQEAERERRTDEAIADIEDKTAEYNANAEAKTNAFNNNATQKTNDFNSNATQKVNDFNSNASSKTSAFNSNAETKTNTFNTNATNKTNAFNSNATEKTTTFDNNASTKTSEFNTNAESKTSAFNDNATQKTTNFDNNVTEKTDEFNTNAQEKIDEYDEHIVEYQAQIDELQEEVEELSENMPWNTTEQATEIQVTDAAKYSRNKLELFGNTEQTQYTGVQLLDMSDAVNGYFTGDAGNTNTSTGGFYMQEYIDVGNNTSIYGRFEALDNIRIGRFYIQEYNENKESIKRNSIGIYDSVFTLGQVRKWHINLSEGTKYIRLSNYALQKLEEESYVGQYPTKDYWNDLVKATISFSDVDIYEPYVGGVPSPNPDYPQPIHVVTGNNTISIGNTNYSINLGSIELCKIGNYQDYLYKENGNWYKQGAINKSVLNGTEANWSMSDNVIVCQAISNYSISNNVPFVNYFKGTPNKNNGSTLLNNEACFNNNVSYRRFYIKTDKFENIADFKTWLSTNNLIVYCITRNAITTQITNETLIAQLDAIYEHLQLVKGTNNITVTASDLSPYMQLSYMQDLKSKLDNLDSRLALLE